MNEEASKEKWTSELAREIFIQLAKLEEQQDIAVRKLEGIQMEAQQAKYLLEQVQMAIRPIAKAIEGQWSMKEELQLVKFLYCIGKLQRGTVINKVKTIMKCSRQEAIKIMDEWGSEEEKKNGRKENGS